MIPVTKIQISVCNTCERVFDGNKTEDILIVTSLYTDKNSVTGF